MASRYRPFVAIISSMGIVLERSGVLACRETQAAMVVCGNAYCKFARYS